MRDRPEHLGVRRPGSRRERGERRGIGVDRGEPPDRRQVRGGSIGQLLGGETRRVGPDERLEGGRVADGDG
jgi:hypothetical protein